MTLSRKARFLFQRSIKNKKEYKYFYKKCVICGEDNYNLLDVHRIIEGKDGGTYTWQNGICICCSCHRKIHAGQIKILGRYNSTGGEVLEIEDKNGEINYKSF